MEEIITYFLLTIWGSIAGCLLICSTKIMKNNIKINSMEMWEHSIAVNDGRMGKYYFMMYLLLSISIGFMFFGIFKKV